MKKYKALSLQWRVTLLTALILTICSMSITMFSIYSAQTMLYPLLSENTILVSPDDDFIPDNDGSGVPSSPAEEQKQLFDMRSIIFCIMITVLGTGAVWFVSGKALKPIRTLSNKVSEIDEKNLSQRLPESASKDEIGQLTEHFNHMLIRLEEAFKRQKRFTASAAHELKTPLATVKAGMQVLKRDKNATLQDYQDNAEITVQSIDRLTGVVNDLLLLASTEETKETIKEQVYLEPMFEAIFEELSPLYEKLGIRFHAKCEQENIVGNPTMLYRAFYNLIENACKYNRPGGSINAFAYADNDSVFIEISDTGVGISKDHLPLVCEPFYRVDASRSRKTAGAGLGLSIVQTIIEKHGGTITVESELDAGSTFTVIFPKG